MKRFLGVIHWDETVKAKPKDSKDAVEEELISMLLEDRAYSLYEFAEAINRDREPETSGEDDLKSRVMVFAASDSLKTGKPISIKDY